MGAERMGVLDMLRRLLFRPNGGPPPSADRTRLADRMRAERERDREAADALARRVSALERYDADGEMRFGSGE